MKKLISFCLLLSFLFCLFSPLTVFAASDTPGSVIDSDDMSRMIENVLEEFNVSNLDIAVSYTYLRTGDSFSRNGDHWFDGCALYMVPLTMKLCNSQSTATVDELDRMYGVDTSLSACLLSSSNRYGMLLQEQFLGPWENLRKSELELSGLSGNSVPQNFLTENTISSNLMNGILVKLYSDSASYGKVLSYMKQAQPDEYLRSGNSNYEIAQKYGADIDLAHVAGIVYTEHPFALTIMTSRLGNNYASKLFGTIADRLIQYTKTVIDPAADAAEAQQAAEAEERARLEAQKAEEARKAAEEEAERARRAAAQEEAERVRLATLQEEENRKASAEEERRLAAEAMDDAVAVNTRDDYTVVYFIAGVILLIILFIVLRLLQKRQQKKNAYRYYN